MAPAFTGSATARAATRSTYSRPTRTTSDASTPSSATRASVDINARSPRAAPVNGKTIRPNGKPRHPRHACEIEVPAAHIDDLAADLGAGIATQRSADDHGVALDVGFRSQHEIAADGDGVVGDGAVDANRPANRDGITVDRLALFHGDAAAEPDAVILAVTRTTRGTRRARRPRGSGTAPSGGLGGPSSAGGFGASAGVAPDVANNA